MLWITRGARRSDWPVFSFWEVSKRTALMVRPRQANPRRGNQGTAAMRRSPGKAEAQIASITLRRNPAWL
jgi:hypothetical protein